MSCSILGSRSTALGLASLAFLVAPAAAASVNLRVISYNVWGVPVITPARTERIEAIAQELAGLAPDVVALQEVWEADDAATLARVLAAAGLPHQRDYGPARVGGRGSGLWMASRHPILDDTFERFEIGHKPYLHWHLDYLSSKGVALLRIDTPAGPVAVANTHLQSTYTVGDYTFIQLAQVLTIDRLLAPVEAPLILGGDINAEPRSIVSEVLLHKLGLVPAASTFGIDIVAARSSTDVSVVAQKLEHRFEDRVVMPNGEKRTLSDHPCVVADYVLGPCDDCRPPVAWSDTRARLTQFIADNAADTALFMTVTKTASVTLVPLSLLLLRIGRRRRVRGVAALFGLALVLLLFLTAGWLAYAGWSYGPYKLMILDRLRAMA